MAGHPTRVAGWGARHEDDDRAGALFEEERTFDGITIPSRGRVGWWLGIERWPEGELFRFEIDDASFEAGIALA